MKLYLNQRCVQFSFTHSLAGSEVMVKSREIAENSISSLSTPRPAPLGPKPLSSEPVLGMTLHRKSIQPVGDPRSPPAASQLWAQTAWIKVTLHSHCAPCGPRAKEPRPPLLPLHPLSLAVSLLGFVTLCYTLHPLSYTHTT